jgi:uncharacterized protein
MNRLSGATSPYLLQHAGNPVDWQPWSDEAFEEARRRDVPVLLSVGYSACHWCHVMAHESFEDEETAALLNEHMVAIKVDREERPDVDAVYMTATQIMTGQGGWPMTVFMTPDREPFYCGTYFPRDVFQQLIRGVADGWRDDRDSVAGHARKVTDALTVRGGAGVRDLREASGGVLKTGGLATVCEQAAGGLAQEYDASRGGFGGAPKFPPSMVLEFLLRHHVRTGQAQVLDVAARTMDAMARGGMYDQLGGGFARYSTDASWIVPHFEKMLYDNALLARDYVHLWRQARTPLARQVAEQTCDWMVRELGTAEGGLAAALDADSEGEEGKFYRWTPAELTEVLGPDDGAWAAGVFGVTEAGTFERGYSVLQLRADPSDPVRFARVRDTLLAARSARVWPGRDDKVVAAWNGMAIAALAETGLLLHRPDLVEAGTAAADLLARVHLRDEGGELRLYRTSRDGVAGDSAGLLEDYACVADGFLALSGVSGEHRWVGLAGRLLDTALARFGDGEGGFYDTADDGEPLLYRPADPADNATPSGTFAVAGALLGYAALTGSPRHREAAVAALGPLPVIGERYPRAAGAGLAVAEALLAGPAEIAVVGPPDDPRTAALHEAALGSPAPGAVVALGDGAGAGAGGGGAGRAAGGAGGGAGVPLLAGRGLVQGAPAAYVCRDFTCHAPVVDPADLVVALSGRL